MHMILVFLPILLIYSLVNIMIARKLLLWLSIMIPAIPARPVYLLYTLCALSPLLMILLPSRGLLRRCLTEFAYTWMGAYLYLFLAVSAAIILLGIGFRLCGINQPARSRVILACGWLIVITVTAVLTYGRIHTGNIRLNTYDITVDRKNGPDNLTVALISDLHLGLINDAGHLTKVVTQVNAMEPDVVCIAGDIFDGDFDIVAQPEQITQLFDSINSKYGVYACLGNHDAGPSYDQMIAFLEQTQIQLLNDEFLVVDDTFIIAGRKDSRPIGEHGRERSGLSDDGYPELDLPVIVLDHQPSNIHEYGAETDLILCGHTHRGQVWPGSLVTGRLFDVDYGWYQKDEHSPQVIVTSGAGTWGPPFRIGTDNEAVCIRIKVNH